MLSISVDSTVLTTLSAVAGLIAGLVTFVDFRRRRTRSRPPDFYAIRSIDVHISPRIGLDTAFLLRGSDLARSVTSLEDAISEGDQSEIVKGLENSDVLALGHALKRGGAEESELLHFEIKSGNETRLVLPVFTQPIVLQRALKEHPEWQAQSILEFKGADLLSARGEEVGLMIDPWSVFQYELPPKDAPAEVEGK